MIHPYIKALLGFDPKTSDKTVRREWNKRIKNVSKPCWELKYCPYGPLVETFPLLRPTREEAIEHNNFVKQQLEVGAYRGKRKLMLEKWCKSSILMIIRKDIQGVI